MKIDTPIGPIVLADSTRDLSAQRYLLFNQAWVQAMGEGSDIYGTDSHLARLGLFLSNNNLAAAQGEYNNLVLQMQNLASDTPKPLLAATLAPLVVSIAGKPFESITKEGLENTATVILASGITQGDLEKGVTDAKKNFMKSSQ